VFSLRAADGGRSPRVLMPSFRQIFSGKKENPIYPRPLLLQDLWDAVARFSAEIRASDFMQEMFQRQAATGSKGMMGMSDCATLYGLARWQRPAVVVESGGYLGMSSAFMLKALADENLTNSKVYSIEMDPTCDHGVLVPEEFRSQFVPLRGDVKELIKTDALPSEIDLFLHDSSHRYRHMLWEFRAFWPRLHDRGMLVSHDVHFNAAFPEFIAKTYAHDQRGLLDADRTRHYEWGRWGYVGFAVKKA
jgi:predicted O-methyltransferase YrrM